MITVKEARQNVTLHETRIPVNDITTIDEMIRVSSLLGAHSVTIWVSEKNSEKFRKQLRKSGFHVETSIGAALNGEALMEITWQIADFMIKDEVRIIK
jgi:hypothetical protein